MPSKPSRIPKQVGSLRVWHKVSIAMRRPPSGRRVCFGGAPRRDRYTTLALSRFVAERHYSWLEGYMKWLEGKEERVQYHALLEEELASLRG
jgi:hypothetical protein